MSILDILIIFVCNIIALDMFHQSSFRKVKLGIVGVFPDEQGSCCVECVCDARAVDYDSHASLSGKRLMGSVLDEMAGQRR